MFSVQADTCILKTTQPFPVASASAVRAWLASGFDCCDLACQRLMSEALWTRPAISSTYDSRRSLSLSQEVLAPSPQTWSRTRWSKMSVAGLKKQFHKASQVRRRLLLLVHNNCSDADGVLSGAPNGIGLRVIRKHRTQTCNPWRVVARHQKLIVIVWLKLSV